VALSILIVYGDQLLLLEVIVLNGSSDFPLVDVRPEGQEHYQRLLTGRIEGILAEACRKGNENFNAK